MRFPLLASMNLSVIPGTASSTLSHSPGLTVLLPDCNPGTSSNCPVPQFPHL